MAAVTLGVALSLPARYLRHSFWRLWRQRARNLIRAYVLANRLQPLQNALPLRPIKLAQERPKTLNERIFENSLSIRFRHEETVQADTQSFGNLFQSAKAGRHLAAFDPGQV
jgi:hypothetical protein